MWFSKVKGMEVKFCAKQGGELPKSSFLPIHKRNNISCPSGALEGKLLDVNYIVAGWFKMSTSIPSSTEQRKLIEIVGISKNVTPLM